ncbi:diacylglycerol pyrophosphate phosphatase [Fusarium heterosporum]|uniref:Diacylglycerol pyrophosphate phosphatase n=1 Tax=Fusarium heterosporum TaxID=42747 RepID=A0A8H5WSY7_FUSHE|nr:diacylglycerol pyrophosphate phosphatase [Fusarium heterosporum]
MADSGIGTLPKGLRGRRFPVRLILSYISDWIVCFIFVGIGGWLDKVAPAKRPFSLVDPNISYPFAEHELVPAYLLFVLAIGFPFVIVAVISLIFVPGPTVPKGTPKKLIWQRKLWELHVGVLGLVLSLTLSWFFTSSMKNLFGKPRPDLLARCDPDWKNINKYLVGGFEWQSMTGQLVSADICQQKDKYKIDDGFRSYPSGHSSTAAGGLIYASLFIASKFAVTVPFVMPSAASVAGAASHAAFPSRINTGSVVDPYEPSRSRGLDGSFSSAPTKERPGQDTAKVQSLRRQAAAPPVYLLALGLVPFAVSIFIAGSRWHDRRHHGFDILFGYLMGLIASIFAFRYYHLPIRAGAGWAWGPRSDERAFWAGVGRHGYAGTDEELGAYAPHRDTGLSGDTSYPPMTSALAQRNVRPAQDQEPRPSQKFQDVELQRMDDSDRLENRFPDNRFAESRYGEAQHPENRV